MKILACFILGLLLTSCGSHPTKVEPFQELAKKEGKVRMYVYFDCNDSLRAGPTLYINNVKKAYLGANMYYASYVEAENLKVNVDVTYFPGAGQDNISIEPSLFQNEDEVYIKYFTNYDEEKTTFSKSVINLYLVQVPNQIGRNEISNCHRATKSYYSRTLAE